jgi:tetratricopeptide (TPR) repeat protein
LGDDLISNTLKTIIIGLVFILIGIITFKSYISYYLLVYGYIAVTDRIFFMKEYYNRNIYLIQIILFLIGSVIIYLSPLPSFHNILYVYFEEIDTLKINIIVIGTILLILIIASSAIKMMKYSKLLDPIKSTIKLNPTNTDLIYSKGQALRELGEYDKSVEIYNQVLELDPENIDVLYSKGIALKDLGKYDKSIKCYNHILRLDPHNFNAYFGKGLVYKILGNNAEANDYFNKAIELKKNNYKNLR